jgi:hypothetical protein
LLLLSFLSSASLSELLIRLQLMHACWNPCQKDL